MPDTLGDTLRGLRHARGLTLEEVAEATGVSIAMLSRAERDQRTPSPQVLGQLAEYYGVVPLMLERLAVAERFRHRASQQPRQEARAVRRERTGALRSSELPQFSGMDEMGLGFDGSRLRTPPDAFLTNDNDLETLSEAAHVAEVALTSAVRAAQRARASGDPAQVAEAERVLRRLRALVEGR